MAIDEVERRILALFDLAVKEENTDCRLAGYAAAIALGKPVFGQMTANGQ